MALSSMPSWKTVLVVSVTLRIALLVFGEWQDRNMIVKFTDVDYHVFTDAARHISEGRSPYERATYRYTPLLAYLLTLNLSIHACIGKLIFSALDLAVGWFIRSIVKQGGHSESVSVVCACVWLFNPLTLTVSTRGNAESLLAILVLASIWLLYRRCTVSAGVLVGVAAHTKLFPMIYSLPMFLLIDQAYGASPLVSSWSRMPGIRGGLSRFLRPRRLLFAMSAATSFLLLFVWMYWWFGDAFVHETYLYHLTRRDNRHNFSVYFYSLYLSWQSSLSSLLSVAAFLPQATLLLVTSVLLYRDIALCCFVETFIFVTFNKVCTSQYFIWYLCLLPLILPASRLTVKKGCALVALWGASQGLWLAAAYFLEFEGYNTFLFIWMASLIFFCSNAFILATVLAHHTVTPSFTTPREKND
eukprot:scpid65544/ scgid10299/ GPI mannosyltransferase 1; GPI mannosyltransferase I; Phosphatidylinositol-glycan biosynthesis class M protein